MAALATLVDRFSTGTRDAAKWNVDSLKGVPSASVTVAQTGGRVVITPPTSTAGSHFKGYESAVTYDLTGSSAHVKFVQTASPGGASTAETALVVGLASNNTVECLHEDTTMYFMRVSPTGPQGLDANYAVHAFVTYDEATMAWERIRHVTADNTIRFETAGGGTSPGTWTQRGASLAAPFALTAVSVSIEAGTYQSEASVRPAILDAFNTDAITEAPGDVRSVNYSAIGGAPSTAAAANAPGATPAYNYSALGGAATGAASAPGATPAYSYAPIGGQPTINSATSAPGATAATSFQAFGGSVTLQGSTPNAPGAVASYGYAAVASPPITGVGVPGATASYGYAALASPPVINANAPGAIASAAYQALGGQPAGAASAPGATAGHSVQALASVPVANVAIRAAVVPLSYAAIGGAASGGGVFAANVAGATVQYGVAALGGAAAGAASAPAGLAQILLAAIGGAPATGAAPVLPAVARPRTRIRPVLVLGSAKPVSTPLGRPQPKPADPI